MSNRRVPVSSTANQSNFEEIRMYCYYKNAKIKSGYSNFGRICPKRGAQGMLLEIIANGSSRCAAPLPSLSPSDLYIRAY